MEALDFYLPTHLMYGVGMIQQLGKETMKYGKRAMIVTGQGSTKRTGLLDHAISLLKKEGLSVIVFDQVKPNPLASTVEAGAEIAKENDVDIIVGLGGGSILDCSKAIAFAIYNEGNIFDYIYGKKTGSKALPLILVPTTCGTGSEGNSFAVLTDDETKDKKSLRNTALIAKTSIVDPTLMTTMPKSILASVGFDALCHCMEAYISRLHTPITDLFALKGMELLGNHLVDAYHDSTDIEAWSAIALSSTYGGMVINQTGVTAPHGLEHPASGLKNITHGRGLAALTPVIYERSISSDPERFRTISKILGGTDEFDCVKQIRKLLNQLDLNISLTSEGITEKDIPWMTENAFKVSLASIQNHPKVFTENEISDIFKDSL